MLDSRTGQVTSALSGSVTQCVGVDTPAGHSLTFSFFTWIQCIKAGHVRAIVKVRVEHHGNKQSSVSKLPCFMHTSSVWGSQGCKASLLYAASYSSTKTVLHPHTLTLSFSIIMRVTVLMHNSHGAQKSVPPQTLPVTCYFSDFLFQTEEEGETKNIFTYCTAHSIHNINLVLILIKAKI